MKKLNRKRNQHGSVLLVTSIIILLISIAVILSMGGLNHQEIMSRNDQFRLTAVVSASSEISAQIQGVNSNNYNNDDQIILDLLGSSGIDRDFEMAIEDGTANPILTNTPHTIISGVSIDGEMANGVPCPGQSVGTTKVLMGTIHARAQLGDSGIESTQRQHFLYCWP